MAQSPAISVIVPVYNQREFIREALESILTQTFHSFEIIVVDDGSTDDTLSLIRGFDDGRIHLDLQTHRGVVSSLNRALGLARAPLVARMDADDIAEPNRLEDQHRYLNTSPDIAILGTNYTMIDSAGDALKTCFMPETDPIIKIDLCTNNALCHPSVMMRREVIEKTGPYREEAAHAEDYDLWVRALPFFKFHNLQQSLLRYRVNPKAVTRLNRETQVKIHSKLGHDALCWFMLHPEVLERLRLQAFNLGTEKKGSYATQRLASLICLQFAPRVMRRRKIRVGYRWFRTGLTLYPGNSLHLLKDMIRQVTQDIRRVATSA